jgi:LPXTG-motif cell wall-anchored protein
MRVSRLLLNRSVLWLVLGIAVWVQSGISLHALTLLLGLALLVDGVIQVVHSVGSVGPNGRWAGFVGIAQGVLSFLIRSITAQQVLIYLAFWGIATGIIAIVVALRERKHDGGNFWFVLAGVAALGFGFLLLSRSRRDMSSVLALIPIGAVGFAIVLAVLAVAAYIGEARRSNSAVGTRA